MSTKKNIILLGSVVLVALAVGGYFLLLSPRMATAGDINAQRESVAVSNDVTRSQIAELQKMKDDIGTAKADADLLTRRFPPTAAQAELFEHIKRAAFVAGLPERKISTLTITVPSIGASNGSVSLGTTAAPPAAPADPAAPVDPAAGAAPSTATGAASAGGQLATMNVDLSVSGPQRQLSALIGALESMDRAFIVKSVNLAGSQGGDYTLTLTGQMFMLPELVDPTAPVETPATTTDTSAAAPSTATTPAVPATP